MKITSHKLNYRGFELGFAYQTPRKCPSWYAAWRSLTSKLPVSWKTQKDGWAVAHMKAKDQTDTIRLAKECVDYNYRIEAEELLLGRKLKVSELPS